MPISALMMRDAENPPDKLVTTCSIVSFAISSAACTAFDDRGAGRFEIDDRPVAQAARNLMTDADDLRFLRLDPGDEAAHLGCADIERGHQAAVSAGDAVWAVAAPGAAYSSHALRGFAASFGSLVAHPHLVDRGHVFFAGGRPFLAVGASFWRLWSDPHDEPVGQDACRWPERRACRMALDR